MDFDLGFARHRTLKLGPSRFGEPMTRLSEPGHGQSLAKTQPKTWVMGCGFVPTLYGFQMVGVAFICYTSTSHEISDLCSTSECRKSKQFDVQHSNVESQNSLTFVSF